MREPKLPRRSGAKVRGELPDEITSWQRNPMTEQCMRSFEQRAEKLLVSILDRGRASSDAAVRAAVAEYDTWLKAADAMSVEGGKR